MALLSIFLTAVLSTVAAHVLGWSPISESPLPEMTCQRIDAQYVDLRANRLDSDTVGSIKRHINSCCRCRAKYKPYCPTYRKAFRN
jgi:hypothetical protein